MQRFTPSQISLLNQLYAAAGDDLIPGSWLTSGTVLYTKLDPVTLNAALDGRYVRLVTAFGGQVVGTYNNLRILLPTGGYINFDGSENAVVAIGGAADGIRIGNPTDGNYLVVEADGTLKFVGAATIWDDMRFPASGFNPAGSTAPPTVDTSTGMLLFSGTADNIIGGIAQMPHSWKVGSTIRPHMHLRFPTASANNTRWSFGYDLANVDGNFVNAYGTYTAGGTITVANPNNALKHAKASFSTIDMTGYTMSCCIMWRITRLAASDAADNDLANCALLEFDIHFEIDTVGSRQEFIK